jgi:hypothetical protein
MFLVPRPAPRVLRVRDVEAAQLPISCKAGRRRSRRAPSVARRQEPPPTARGETLVGPELPAKI